MYARRGFGGGHWELRTTYEEGDDGSGNQTLVPVQDNVWIEDAPDPSPDLTPSPVSVPATAPDGGPPTPTGASGPFIVAPAIIVSTVPAVMAPSKASDPLRTFLASVGVVQPVAAESDAGVPGSPNQPGLTPGASDQASVTAGVGPALLVAAAGVALVFLTSPKRKRRRYQ